MRMPMVTPFRVRGSLAAAGTGPGRIALHRVADAPRGGRGAAAVAARAVLPRRSDGLPAS